jgi:nucleoside 2-deoxyribosyltransferase
MKKPKIYIAGKVTGLPLHEVIAKFNDAKSKLETYGFEVINPLEIVKEKADGFDSDWQTAMRFCIAAMMTADAVYLLKDWQDSNGARIEKQIADMLNIFAIDSLFILKKHFKK